MQYIYFIEDGSTGFIKIGISEDPTARLRELQTSNPARLRILATMKGDRQQEQRLHKEFAELRVNGEWFKPSKELMRLIEWQGGLGSSEHSLKLGYWVALTLKENTAPGRCFVGQIEAIDEHGVRITLIDWIMGRATGFDFYTSWENITCALVCTPEHAMDEFGEEARRWQGLCHDMGKEPTEA